MADEDLLIGGKKNAEPQSAPSQGSTGIQVPMDFVKVSVFGVFKDSEKKDTTSTEDEYVEQVFQTQKPRNAPDEDVAQFIWMKFLQNAALRAPGSKGEFNFYPLDRFKRFAITVGTVVGVTL